MESFIGSVARSRTRKKARRSSLRFYGDEFVFDTVSGLFFRISPTAGYLLGALESGSTREELPQLLQERYHLDRATATRDVALFLNDLADLEPLVGLNS